MDLQKTMANHEVSVFRTLWSNSLQLNLFNSFAVVFRFFDNMANRMFHLSNEKDLEKIRNILVGDNDEYPAQTEYLCEESDIASEDGGEEIENDTATEQEYIDDEEACDTVEGPIALGKDGNTKWTRKT